MRPLAVFDIDGTLVDSRASIHRATTEAAQALGLPPPDYDRVRRIVGLTLEHAMAVLEPGLPPADLARFTAEFRLSFHRMFEAGHQEPLYDGVMDHLHRLKRDGWRLALATGQNRRGVARNRLARVGPICFCPRIAPRTVRASPIRPCSTPPWPPAAPVRPRPS